MAEGVGFEPTGRLNTGQTISSRSRYDLFDSPPNMSTPKAKPYIHKPLGAPDYALPDLPYAFRSLDDYDFIDVEEPEHELSEKEKDFKPDKTE